MNPQRLFVASCIALLATAMSFAIRGDIMSELELAFGLDKIQLGWISGAAFWGFGLSILFGGTLCDLLGMGRLLKLAAVGHIAGVLLTVFATDFTMLFAATVVIGIANGFVEAGINPLIATLYRQDKTARLVKLHAWFPGGIVVGGVLAFAFTQIGLGWQAKMLLMLLPSAVYAAMFFAQRFPDSERKAAGVSTAAMYGELKRPLFLVVFICMWLTAATELGPGQWVSNIFNEVMHSTLQAGVLLLVWINGIMYALRQFGGGLAHRLSPVTLVAVTAPIAALGLWLFGHADTPVLAFAAAALLAVGTAFWWPTMLGLTSERFPRGGALALAVVGAAGAFSTAVAGPVMGWINNTYGAANVLPMWAVLPVAIALIFGIVHWVDRSRGGYRIERVDA
ncbi:MFS transporter [Pseudoxanthomonas wuyuanensis]